MDEEKEVSEPDPPERQEPATGERADHQPIAPGVDMPRAGAPEAQSESAEDEPEPGEHPTP